jgi:signal transduction histidine kinase
VLAADDDRRRIERELHEGLQQRLVALAVRLELAGRSAETDPPTTRALLEAMARDVQQALDESAQLAERIYPPLLETGGLAAALRSAAAGAGVPITIELAPGDAYPSVVAAAVYSCCVEAIEATVAPARASVRLLEDEAVLAFEIVDDGESSEARLERLRDRVEAFGGRLTVKSETGPVSYVCGSIPLSG